MSTIMNHEHPQWKEFLERLEGPEGCHFRPKSPPALQGGDDPSNFVWRCKHDHTSATKIMQDMDEIDIEASLSHFRANGGYCDCEILFNVARR